jgi:hypothetical protein
MDTFFTPLMLERLYEMLGEVSPTAKVTIAVPSPPGPDAITVYAVEDEVPEGVPEMLPVKESSNSPEGRAGLTWYTSTGPPDETMVFTVMDTCFT